jgi:hypothetical protein
MAWRGAFLPGADTITFGGGAVPQPAERHSIVAGPLLVEKFLTVINQPGLIGQRLPVPMREAIAKTLSCGGGAIDRARVIVRLNPNA